jgi:hypothetical protein
MALSGDAEQAVRDKRIATQVGRGDAVSDPAASEYRDWLGPPRRPGAPSRCGAGAGRAYRRPWKSGVRSLTVGSEHRIINRDETVVIVFVEI